jgi:hypothetical protein
MIKDLLLPCADMILAHVGSKHAIHALRTFQLSRPGPVTAVPADIAAESLRRSGVPVATVGAPDFGVIRTTDSTPRQMQFALSLTF